MSWTSDLVLHNTLQHRSALVITHSSFVDISFSNARLPAAWPFPLQLKSQEGSLGKFGLTFSRECAFCQRVHDAGSPTLPLGYIHLPYTSVCFSAPQPCPSVLQPTAHSHRTNWRIINTNASSNRALSEMFPCELLLQSLLVRGDIFRSTNTAQDLISRVYL